MSALRWAVVGVGRAGRARARAISADPRAELVAVHRGRFASEIDAPELPLTEAIARADAIAVCSPTGLHAEHADLALAAGRHVVVEFPLAADPRDARRLLERARDRDRVLHVEHIELLAATTRVLQDGVRDLGRGTVTHGARRDAPAGADDLAALLVPRLHRLAAVVGPLGRGRLTDRGEGWLRARVEATRGGIVDVHVEAGPELSRSTWFALQCASGLWELRDRSVLRDGVEVLLPDAPPLFEQDQLVATARILDGAAPYLPDEDLLGTLERAHRVARAGVGEEC